MALPTFVAAGAFNQGTAAITIPFPAGIQVDDILVAFVHTENQACSIANQAGGTWTEEVNSPQGTGTAGSGGTRLTAFWSRYNGTQTIPTTNDSGNHQKGAMLAFRGCITTENPVHISAGDVASSASTSVSIPGATTSVADCMVVVAVGNTTDTGTPQTSGWTNANLANLLERIDGNSTTGLGGGFGVATGEKASAGNYGTTTATLLTSSIQGRISLALKGGSSSFSGSGAASVTQPAISAVGVLAFIGSAALGVSQPAVAGTGALIESRTGSGALAVTPPSIAATGQLVFTATGALSVTPPAISGMGDTVFNVAGTGALGITAPSIAGTGSITQASVSGSGALTVPSPAISGTALETFAATGALAVTPPTAAANGLLSFDATGALGVPTTISGTGLETFIGTGALLVPQPVVVGGESVSASGAIARSVGTVAIRQTHTGSVSIGRMVGTSIMDTYTASSEGWTASADAPNAAKSPMGS